MNAQSPPPQAAPPIQNITEDLTKNFEDAITYGAKQLSGFSDEQVDELNYLYNASQSATEIPAAAYMQNQSVSACTVKHLQRRFFMTELERELLAENDRLKRELVKLKEYLYRAVSLHEAVWRFHFGDICEGYVIHHRNGDKDVEILQIITAAQHRARHNQHDKISYRCDYCGKKFSICKYRKTKICSDACHYKLLSLSKRKKKF